MCKRDQRSQIQHLCCLKAVNSFSVDLLFRAVARKGRQFDTEAVAGVSQRGDLLNRPLRPLTEASDRWLNETFITPVCRTD